MSIFHRIKDTIFDSLSLDNREYIDHPVLKIRPQQGKAKRWRFQAYIGKNSGDRGKHCFSETVSGHATEDGALAAALQVAQSEILIYNSRGELVLSGHFVSNSE